MEIEMSEADASTINLTHNKKRQMVALVHLHIGLASIATATLISKPEGIRLTTASGTIIVDRALTRKLS